MKPLGRVQLHDYSIVGTRLLSHYASFNLVQNRP
jgi:hypothetical protein